MQGDDLHVPEISKPEPRRPTKEFADAAIAIAKERWKTNAGILRAMGYEPSAKNNTLRLLQAGRGSDKAARALRDALKNNNVDIAKLPPMYEDEEKENADWRDEWMWIGEMLHDHAPGIFDGQLDDLRPLAGAIAKKIGAERDAFRPT